MKILQSENCMWLTLVTEKVPKLIFILIFAFSHTWLQIPMPLYYMQLHLYL